MASSAVSSRTARSRIDEDAADARNRPRDTQLTQNTVFTAVTFCSDDEDDILIDDDQSLGCGWKYIGLCILLPLCNGLTIGFAWSVLFLYFHDMNWPLWHAASACAGGFLTRMLFQYIQLTYGIWVAVPASIVHLSSCILAVILTQDEWAILFEMVCVFGLDPTMSIEGIVYDSCKFASSVSRQATSTSLSVMASSVSMAAFLGGLLYDLSSWTGIAVMHTSCQGILLCVLLLQPSTQKSFKDVFWRQHRKKSKSPKSSRATKPKPSETLFERRSLAPDQHHVVHAPLPGAPSPNGEASFPASGEEMAVEEVEDGPEAKDIVPTQPRVTSQTGRRTETAKLQQMLDEMEDDEEKEDTTAAQKAAQESFALPADIKDDEEEEDTTAAQKAAQRSSGLSADVKDDEEEEDTTAAQKAAQRSSGLSADVKDVNSDALSSAWGEMSPASMSMSQEPSDRKEASDKKVRIGGSTFKRATVSGRRTEGNVLAGYLEDLEADDLEDEPGKQNSAKSQQADTRKSRQSTKSRKSRRSNFSRKSNVSRRSTRSKAPMLRPVTSSPVQSNKHRGSRSSHQSWFGKRRQSEITDESGGTKMTGATIGTAITTMTNLVDAGMHFEHHFAVNASLRPKIAARAGREKKKKSTSKHSDRARVHSSEVSAGSDNTSNSNASAMTSGTNDITWWLPQGTRLPAALILFMCFASHCSYMTLCSVYAIYYREQRGWSQAMYAGICQTCGEFLAAAAMRTLSSNYSLTDQEEEPSWCITRFYRKLTEKPYDLSWVILFWACLNACFMLPWVPGAVIANVLMASVYAFSSKLVLDLCLVYAMGDPDIFMTLQDLARRIEAIGAILSCCLGPVLYSMAMPNAPFIVTASLCGFALLLYTVTFCFALTIPDEDEYDDDDIYYHEESE